MSLANHRDIVSFKEREPCVFVRRGSLSVKNGSVEFSNSKETKPIPVGILGCLFLEPGTSITHEAVKACAQERCGLYFVGENGLKLYSIGYVADGLYQHQLTQFKYHSVPATKLKVAQDMMRMRFDDVKFSTLSDLDALRGLEGHYTKTIYNNLANKHKIMWLGRLLDLDFELMDKVNQTICITNSWLYALTEQAILMSGYNPSIGFIHSYKTLSFVYDIADLYKFELSVPVAFEYIAAYNAGEKVSLKQMFIKKVNDCNFTSSVISKINKLFDGHNQTT